MKSVAWRYVWWPTINQDIESCTRECKHSQLFKKDPANTPNHSWEKPTNPWEWLHIDFVEPFKGHMWLILVSALTKWPEVIQMSSTSSERTIEVLRSLSPGISRYPTIVHSSLLTHSATSAKGMEFTTNCQHHIILALTVRFKLSSQVWWLIRMIHKWHYANFYWSIIPHHILSQARPQPLWCLTEMRTRLSFRLNWVK